ncbi:MAG: hypothetical protein CL908_05470 [Deltaproteobacteria bacterium]|nr:hypothetical protein [Deltaproteobacteria bacterium]
MTIRVAVLLVLACLVGLFLRATNIAGIFPPDGPVVLGMDDAFYHARRALYTFEHFPSVLEHDAYLAYPRGAAQPSPPLQDWLIAGTTRLIGGDYHTLEVVAAWISPLLGSLLSLCAFLIARALAGAAVGLVAAWLVAITPAGTLLTSLGNCDHHATVALLASLWLASSLRELDLHGRRLAWHIPLYCLTAISLIFTWSGSLLYIAIGEGARLATILSTENARRERFGAVAAGALICSALISIWLLSSAPPLGGTFTSGTLSWLHAMVLLCIAILSAILAMLEGLRPIDDGMRRVARAALIAVGVALPCLFVAEVRESLISGLDFLGKRDAWAETNLEQMPLFGVDPSTGVLPPTTRFGALALAIPLLPLLIAFCGWRARDASERSGAKWLLVLLWMLPLWLLALLQIRFTTDFAVLAAVGCALLLNEMRRLLASRIGSLPATAGTALVVLATLIPVYQYFAPRVGFTVDYLSRLVHGTEPAPNEPFSRVRSRYEFARLARSVTPETSGFLDATQGPEYGVLVPPSEGHLFTYVARRPLPASNFGPHLDPELFEEASAFYRASRPEEAIAILESLQVRYFVTSLDRVVPNTFADAVHRNNDSSTRRGDRHGSGRIRLVTSGPRRGRPVELIGPPGRRRALPPHKLFELVAGAVLVGRVSPNQLATAEISLTTPSGRVRHRVVQRVGESGQLRLRVPYPTESPTDPPSHVSALGPWRIEVGEELFHVHVEEAAVRTGSEVELGLPSLPQSEGARAAARAAQVRPRDWPNLIYESRNLAQQRPDDQEPPEPIRP